MSILVRHGCQDLFLLISGRCLTELYAFAEALNVTVLRTKISRAVIDVNRDPSGMSLYRGQAKTGLCPLTSFDGEPSYVAGREADDADIQRRRIANGVCLPRLYGRAGNSGAGKLAEPDYFLHTCFACFENHYRKSFAMNRLNNARVIRAPHGSLLAAKSWQTEAPLRVVMNNLDPNEMVVRGELSAPVFIGRDHLDSGSVASPNRETESMLDGSETTRRPG